MRYCAKVSATQFLSTYNMVVIYLVNSAAWLHYVFRTFLWSHFLFTYLWRQNIKTKHKDSSQHIWYYPCLRYYCSLFACFLSRKIYLHYIWSHFAQDVLYNRCNHFFWGLFDEFTICFFFIWTSISMYLATVFATVW